MRTYVFFIASLLSAITAAVTDDTPPIILAYVVGIERYVNADLDKLKDAADDAEATVSIGRKSMDALRQKLEQSVGQGE